MSSSTTRSITCPSNDPVSCSASARTIPSCRSSPTCANLPVRERMTPTRTGSSGGRISPSITCSTVRRSSASISSSRQLRAMRRASSSIPASAYALDSSAPSTPSARCSGRIEETLRSRASNSVTDIPAVARRNSRMPSSLDTAPEFPRRSRAARSSPPRSDRIPAKLTASASDSGMPPTSGATESAIIHARSQRPIDT